MIRLPRALATFRERRNAQDATPLTQRARLLSTLGNFFTLSGIVVLLYVGGLYANDAYGRYAARGDTDVPAPIAVDRVASDEPPPFQAALPRQPAILSSSAPLEAPATPTSSTEPHDSRANPPVAAASSAEEPQAILTPVPVAVAAPERVGTVTRVVIPSVDIDSKVVPVGWDYEQQGDTQVPVWQVAKYAVGQHRGSANPGDGDNIVLAGHVGGYGHVFRDLYYVRPGEPLTLYSNGKAYNYVIKQRLVVLEDGATPEQQAANAKLIEPTGSEMVTLITCWPGTGKDKFTKRVVVQAVPAPVS